MSRDFRVLLGYLSRYRKRYLWGLLALLICDLGNLTIPRLIGTFTDALSQGRLDGRGILIYAGGIVALALVIAFFRYVWRMYVMGTARQVEFDLRQELFLHLEKLSANFYNTHKTGDLMAHATNDLQAVRAAAGQGVLMAADSFYMGTITLVMMLTLVDWRLTVLGLIPLPLLTLSILILGRLVHQRFARVQAAFSNLSDRAQENIAGIRVIKAFVQEEAEIERFQEENRQYVTQYMRLIRVQGLMEPLIQVFAGLGFVIALGYGGNQVLQGKITLGSFVAFNSYLGMLVWPMIAVGWVVNLAQRGVASMGRIQEILDQVPEVTDTFGATLPPSWAEARNRPGLETGSDPEPLLTTNDPAPPPAPLSTGYPANDDRRPREQPVASFSLAEPTALSATKGVGRIEARQLTFRYSRELPPVLKGINLTVEPGTTLGIIGRTGSGKSTLANLLVRIYNPPPGQLFIDGVDVNLIPLQALRQTIGYVLQDTFLFSRTIAENLAFAPGVTAGPQLYEAAKLAQVDADIQEFPRGYATLLGERGITLSGGQRQRVGIARALLKNPPILILDDCLSAVDTATEAKILAGLRPFLEGRTTIIISHRVSAVKNADQIIVLDHGQIIEQGTHTQLLAREGEYWRIYRRQQLEQDIASLE